MVGPNPRTLPVLTPAEREGYQNALSQYQTPIRFGRAFGLSKNTMAEDQDSDFLLISVLQSKTRTISHFQNQKEH